MTTGQTDKLDIHNGGEGAYDGAKVMESKNSPAERTGSEEDFAGTILFMASRAGGYLNGMNLLTVSIVVQDISKIAKLTFTQDGGRVGVLPATY